jgi:hypothetical protein
MSCSRNRGLGIAIRADNGRFRYGDFPLNHSCVLRVDRLDPPSSRENFLSGGDFERFWLIKAWSGLGWQGKESVNRRGFPNENFRHLSDSRSGLKMGDFHRWAGHEGRRVWQGPLNVGSSAFHEGRGAGKTDPRGVTT